MKTKNLLLLAFSIAGLTWCQPAYTLGIGSEFGLSPFWDWKTIETEHFRITFPADLQDVAERSANIYEEANQVMSPYLHWQPALKTQVLIIDNDDEANGATSAVLRFGMALNVTPPENWFSTAYYDDWLRLLIFHEYTHFLNIDTTRSFWKVARIIFGDIALPNALWPSWMLEGLAVFDETRYTHAGRGRSPYYDMILRSAVEANVLDSPKFITLDKVNGPNPYSPFGETVYLFGYHLMDEISDHGEKQPNLGMLSYKSGGRVPYFINGNLENITGRDFYSYWDQFVAESKTHAQKQLAMIHEKPVTSFTPITQEGGDIEGASESPDGNWLAFPRETPDQITGFFVRDRHTGEMKRIMDNVLGASSAFTPDSRAVVFSSLRRTGEYYLMSDLHVYNLKTGHRHWLTYRLRAKDPDISQDSQGKLWVTFTLTEKAKTSVAIAPLILENDDYHLGEIRKIYDAQEYDRAQTPKFLDHAKRVVFTLHRNTKVSEDLMEIPAAGGTETVLLSDGSFNRFPAIGPHDEIYFVSDKTGVDNLYHLRGPGVAERVSNVTTGIAFPTFGPGELVTSTYSYKGWDLSSLPLSQLGQTYPSNVKVEAPAAPAAKEDSNSHAGHTDYPVNDYSIWPSILPREWAPFGYAAPHEYYAGGEIIGFDATGRHQYLLEGAYDTLTNKPDLYGLYNNFQLGAEIDLSGNEYTNSLSANNGTLLAYSRRTVYSAAVSYPILWTFSSLTPSISYNVDRTSYYVIGGNPSNGDLVYQNTFVPHVDGYLTYSDQESSNLAVTTEEGRTAQFGFRQYIGLSQSVTKFLVSDVEYFRLFDHWVFSPYGYISWATSLSPYLPANVLTQGRYTRIVAPFAATDLDQVPLHGYQNQSFYNRVAEVYGGSLTYPIGNIFRGWGTNPAFLENLSGFSFGEAGVLPSYIGGSELVLPAAGTGLNLTGIAFLQIPLVLGVEYDHGFKQSAGGDNEVYFSLGVSGISL